MIEDFFQYVYVVGVTVIVVMIFVVARLIFSKSEDIQSKLITQNVGSTDAFGRVRITQPFTLGDYKHVYDKNTQDFFDKIVGTGTITHLAEKAAVRITVSGNKNDRTTHQTKLYHPYIPGKSQKLLTSFVFYESKEGISKRTGYFDDENGIFLQQDGNGVLSFIIRNKVTGSVKETKVERSSWNGDRVNGKGKSKWNIDITKTQLFWMDYQWLGVGRVRCGFFHDNEYILCHSFYHSDVLDTVYLSDPNLPVRCEVFNIEGKTSQGHMDQICSTVISEGGYLENGRDWNKDFTVADGDHIIIRLKNTFNGRKNRSYVRLGRVTVNPDDAPVTYTIFKAKTSSATNFTSANDDSFVQYANGTITLTEADQIDSGFATDSSLGQLIFGTSVGTNEASKSKKNYITQNFDSDDSEVFAIKIVGDANVKVSVTWREVS